MMDLLFSVEAVFPLLVMMAAGYAARAAGWVTDETTRRMNACVYRLFLPLLLCFNIMDTKPGARIDGQTLLFAFVGTLLLFGALFVLAPRLCKQRSSCGVLIQGIARSNYAIFGIPLVIMMYPHADTSVAVMMVVVVVPVYNVMSTVALMIYAREKTSALKVVKGIVLNPLIVGTAIGFVLWQAGIALPTLLDNPLRKLGGIATPLSLFLLGTSLDFGMARNNARLLTISVVGRLVAVPLVFLSLAIALGIRDVSLATLIAVFASPTAVSSYPMAQQMGGDEGLAAGQVVFTTAFSSLTVFLWVLVLKSFGFLA